MKSITSALAVLLTAGLLLAQAGCSEAEKLPAAQEPVAVPPAPVATQKPAGMATGTVLETMDSGGYTYAQLDTGQDPIWVAGPQTAVNVGDVIEVSQGMAMNDFHSKTLDRTFEVLYFVSALSAPADAEPAVAEPAVTAPVDVSVPELEPGQNIAWVYANKDSLADQSISLRGKVVKYNSNILGWNFIHIQDGSGDAAEGNNDLTVTSKATTGVGESVVLTGTVILDKDFGAGYKFPILLDDAVIATE